MSDIRRPLPAIGSWRPDTYLIAEMSGPMKVAGRVHAGLGMRQLWPGSPKGRRPPAWNLEHLGTGHRICIIEAHEAEAFALATVIAGMTDWDFDGLNGWENRDPDLMERLRDFIALHPEIRTGAGSDHRGAAIAREIARMRA